MRGRQLVMSRLGPTVPADRSISHPILKTVSLTDMVKFVAPTVLYTYILTCLHPVHRLLEEISTFRKEASCRFLKLFFTKDERIAQIDGYHRHIATSVNSFQARGNMIRS